MNMTNKKNAVLAVRVRATGNQMTASFAAIPLTR